jgi:hypothetical protein
VAASAAWKCWGSAVRWAKRAMNMGRVQPSTSPAGSPAISTTAGLANTMRPRVSTSTTPLPMLASTAPR